MKSGGKILVIEDNDDIREIIKDLLELQGFNVVQANSGPRGIRMAIKEMPELILCDIMMPKMDGFEVFLSLREITYLKETPFLFVTAKSDSATFREAMNLGADDFIVKPFSARDLLDAVSTRLDKSQQAFKHLEGKLERVAISRVNNSELESIRVSSELLLKYGSEMNPEDLRALHNSIHSSAQRITRNKENFELYEILNTSNSADMALSLFFNDRPQSVQKIFDLVQREQIYGDKLTDFEEVSLEPAIPQLPGSLLKKILLEVVDNAIKHRKQKTPISIVGERKEDQYFLSIENQGGSLPMELKSINKPFVRLDSEEKIAGIGFGLYLVSKLCKQFSIDINQVHPAEDLNRVELILPLS